jgi:hypothetical protein
LAAKRRQNAQLTHFLVMAGLVPAIHVFLADTGKTWMPGTSPGMTNDFASAEHLAQISVVVMPPQEIDIGPISFALGAPKLFAVQPQIFLAIVEDFFDLFAYGKPKALVDCHVAGVEDRVDVLS